MVNTLPQSADVKTMSGCMSVPPHGTELVADALKGTLAKYGYSEGLTVSPPTIARRRRCRCRRDRTRCCNVVVSSSAAAAADDDDDDDESTVAATAIRFGRTTNSHHQDKVVANTMKRWRWMNMF